MRVGRSRSFVWLPRAKLVVVDCAGHGASLAVGDLSAGEAFIQALSQQGLVVEEAEQLFVPLQTLDPSDAEGSDRLRHNNPRAFALARRESPQIGDLVTNLRDSMVLGGG